MPDRHPSDPIPNEEVLLDQWLDTLNDAGQRAPEPPAPIADLAATARRYHAALGMTPPPIPARRSPMSHALPLSSPNGVHPRPAPVPTVRRRGWLSHALPTAVMLALLVALVGGTFVRQVGLPGGDDPTRVAGIASSPEATPANGTLACVDDRYGPVVEGDVDPDALAMIGETGPPIQILDDQVVIPTSDGESVTLDRSWSPMGGPLWISQVDPAARGEATIRNIETGQEWTFSDAAEPASPAYAAPYLFVPEGTAGNDWRIVDTGTGEERLVSDIRGEPFPSRMILSQIGIDPDTMPNRNATSVWLFSSTPLTQQVGATSLPTGRNGLILGDNLAAARFIEMPIKAQYFHETAYSPDTGYIAFATFSRGERTIVVMDPRGRYMRAVHDEFPDDTLPLMFTNGGATVVFNHPHAILSFAVGPDTAPAPTTVFASDEAFVPIAHNVESANVLVMFEDRHIAFVNAHTGDLTDVPDVLVPETEYQQSPARISFDTEVYDLFDRTTSTVRFANLVNGTVTPEIRVLDPVSDDFDMPFGNGYYMIVPYPHTDWNGGYAYLEPDGTLHAISTSTGDEMWSLTAPDDLAVGLNQVVDLRVSPNQQCLVLTVALGSAPPLSSERMPTAGRVATWVAPLEPGATWTKLDVALVGWFERPVAPEDDMLPAPDVATPVASPSATPEG